MHHNVPDPKRRSTRLTVQMAVVITSLDPARSFYERCKTLDVNAHGCGVLVGQRLENGTPVTVELPSHHRSAKGRIVVSLPLGEDGATWLHGIEFDSPGNFWGIKDPPPDWS